MKQELHRVNKRCMSLHDQNSALWVDLEGTSDGEVSIIGVGYWESNRWKLDQLVVDSRLTRYVEYSQSRDQNVSQATPHQAFTHLRDLLGQRSGALVAFSSHEADVLPDLAGESGVLLEYDYHDARAIGKAWVKRNFPDQRPRKVNRFDPGSGYSIDWFAQLLGISIPTGYGPGHTGDRLRELRGADANTHRLTVTRKGKWTKLLRHNKLDIEVMRELVRAACP